MINEVKELNLIGKGDIVIVGVSGGCDSVCLLHILTGLRSELDFSLCAVHVNHCIRGEEALRDQKFVEALCEKLNVSLTVEVIDVPAKAADESLSEEEAGRLARQEAFKKRAESLAIEFPDKKVKLALAHNLNDNAETVLLNLARGTGIKGLSGMEPESALTGLWVIRPLLSVSRSQIEEYLAENSLEHVEDSTNAKDGYSRNRIRHIVMPALEEINSKAQEHIVQAAQELSLVNGHIREQALECYKDCAIREGKRILINIEGLEDAGPVLSGEIVRLALADTGKGLRDISRVHINEILALTRKQTGRRVMLPRGIAAERSYGYIIISACAEEKEAPKEHSSIRLSDIEGKGAELMYNGVTITLNIIDVTAGNFDELTQKNVYTKVFDCDKIDEILIFGAAEPDDRISLKTGSKSMKKYFTDEKIPRGERNSLPALKSGRDILWIPGARMGEGFRLSASSRKALVAGIAGGIING